MIRQPRTRCSFHHHVMRPRAFSLTLGRIRQHPQSHIGTQSTVDRMIRRGKLQIEKELHGNRHRALNLVGPGESDELPDGTGTSTEVDLAVLRERLQSLKEIADSHRGLLKNCEWRYQQAMEQLGDSQKSMEPSTRALPAGNVGTPTLPSALVAFGGRRR